MTQNLAYHSLILKRKTLFWLLHSRIPKEIIRWPCVWLFHLISEITHRKYERNTIYSRVFPILLSVPLSLSWCGQASSVNHARVVNCVSSAMCCCRMASCTQSAPGTLVVPESYLLNTQKPLILNKGVCPFPSPTSGLCR